MTRIPAIDDDTLLSAIEAMTEAERDALPFGLVRTTADGVVTHFSRREMDLSGFDAAVARGRNWFRDVAPCMDTPTVRSLLGARLHDAPLDIEFEHVGDFRNPTARLAVRIMETADRTATWIAIARV